MSYYDHGEWLMNQRKESKRRLEEQEEKWAKEQKKLILEEIKQRKGNEGDLHKVYTKKEIAAIKRAELKEIKEELIADQKEELKQAKQYFENSVKHYKSVIIDCKNEYNKTKKRLSKIDKDNLDFLTKELNEKWEKQWGKSQKGTRKNNK
jgi:hypothetical protein